MTAATIVPSRQENRSEDDERGDSDDGPDDATSKDTVFFLLQNRRRRYAISVLKEMGGEADFKELVRRVGAKERGVEPGELEYSQRKSVHTSLYQVHLPKLEEAGIIEYDKRKGYVSLTDKIDLLDEYLEPTPNGETDAGVDLRWSNVLGVIAVVGTVLVAASALNLWPMTAVPEVLLAAALVAVFYVLAFVSRIE